MLTAPAKKPPCANPECGQVHKFMYNGYCEPCNRHIRKHGWRNCQFCQRTVLRSQTPTYLGRFKIVSCKDCRDKRITWWHYLYPNCRNCHKTDRPHQGNGFCEPCNTAYKRHGIRTCTYCNGETIRNYADQALYLRNVVCCETCATNPKPAPWSGDYPACRGCNTTSIPHASQGYCGACRQAVETYDEARICEKCRSATIRSYAKFPRTLCLDCFKAELTQVYEAFKIGRAADTTAKVLVINRKVVRRCYDYLRDPSADILRLTAHDQVGSYLATLHQ